MSEGLYSRCGQGGERPKEGWVSEGIGKPKNERSGEKRVGRLRKEVVWRTSKRDEGELVEENG
jgi:hypothetical protein